MSVAAPGGSSPHACHPCHLEQTVAVATAYLGHELELDETYQTQYGEGLGAVILPAGFHSPITGLHRDTGDKLTIGLA